MVIGNVFRKGHRVRVEISSRNFPRYDRNVNAGQPIGSRQKLPVAHQMVFHRKDYPSHVVLPVIPH